MRYKFEIKKFVNILLFTAAIIIGVSNLVLAQENSKQKSVSGKVIDKTGASLPGVSIVLKGTTIGVNSDATGNYSLTNIPENAILQFSFVGMITQEIVVRKQTSINVILEDETIGLEEVVTVGYGTQKKANLTGAVSSVDSKVLESRPVTNVTQALQGMVPGLNITQSGALGGSLDNRPSINIRGVTTIGQGSSGSPLILIDGMEGDINAVNPDDVDNISVLKDAAASSIYGARAPFGVILVTTKKGKAGKMKVNYSTNFRSSSPILLPKIVDSYTYATYINAANINSGSAAFFGPARLQRIQDFMAGKLGNKTDIPNVANPTYWADGYLEGNDNVDWYGEIFKKSSPSQEHNISISGGNENLTYYLSGNYLNQDGLLKIGSDNFQRYTSTAKINAKLSEWASISYTGRFTREEYSRPAVLSGGFYQNLARQGWPMLPLYDPNGYMFSAPSPALGLRDGGLDKNQDDWTYQQLNLTIEPIKGWKILADLNYKVENNFRHWDTEKTYNHDVNGNPFLYGTTSSVHEEAYRTNYFSPNVYTEYTKSLGNHNFKFLLGYQSESNKYRYLSAERQGVIVPSSPVIDITSGTDNSGKTVSPLVGGQYQEWATTGYFGRINYNYKGRYLAEANLRYDGTSRFRSNMRWKYFPSASFGWNVSHENFWKPIEHFVNSFKIRASYGELGNQNTNSWYPTYVTMPFGSANGTWIVGGVKPNTSSAPGLVSTSQKWETISTYDLGSDMGFLKNRLTATFDYYIRYTNDMIGPAPELPSILGTAVPTTNNTDLKTYGFELAVTWQDRLKNGLGYSAKFILSDSQTDITNYPNPAGNLSTYYPGQKFGEIWGYTTIGIAKTQDEMDAHLASLPNGGQNTLGSNWKAGDIMYKDLDGDGKISAGSSTVGSHGDLSIIGNNVARYSFGLDLSADWKGFDIRTFFQGVLKRDYAQNSYYFWGATGSGIWNSTSLIEHTDYFRNDPADPLGINLDSYYPRPMFSDKNEQTQTRYLQNASYIRLKNLQFGYTIPSVITRKIMIEKCRFYVSGENILTLTNLATMFDPETIDGGYGGNVYPLSKVYSVGVSVTF